MSGLPHHGKQRLGRENAEVGRCDPDNLPRCIRTLGVPPRITILPARRIALEYCLNAGQFHQFQVELTLNPRISRVFPPLLAIRTTVAGGLE